MFEKIAELPSEPPVENGAQEYKSQFRERLGWKLFPYGMPENPEKVSWGTDVLHLNAETQFSFIERLRILFTGRIAFRARIVCQYSPGKTLAASFAWPLPPKYLERREA